MVCQKERTCAFTGHRPNKLPEFGAEHLPDMQKLRKIIYDTIEKAIIDGYDTFLSGMAIGFDILCSETVMALKIIYPNVKLLAAVPFKGQPIKFSDAWKKRYNNVLLACDGFDVLSENYYKGCFQHRNKYMVDNSSLIIACLDSSEPSGTLSTVNYAKKQGLDVINCLDMLHLSGYDS